LKTKISETIITATLPKDLPIFADKIKVAINQKGLFCPDVWPHERSGTRLALLNTVQDKDGKEQTTALIFTKKSKGVIAHASEIKYSKADVHKTMPYREVDFKEDDDTESRMIIRNVFSSDLPKLLPHQELYPLCDKILFGAPGSVDTMGNVYSLAGEIIEMGIPLQEKEKRAEKQAKEIQHGIDKIITLDDD